LRCIKGARRSLRHHRCRLEPMKERDMYRRILVPLDGSDTAERGLTEAIGLASAIKARLVLLNVVVDLQNLIEAASIASYEKMRNRLDEFARKLVDDARRRAAQHDLEADTVVRELLRGRAAEVIVAVAAEQGCDLIVMGTHGRRGLGRLVLGSDAAAVLHDAQVPVLLVGPRGVARED
jgi:nucleotide-binding universal stress UspA family protein